MSSMAALSVDHLTEGVLANSRPQLARAITLIESNRSDHHRHARELLRAIRSHTGQAVRVGVSGVPGAGKSTFIDALGCRLIDQGHRVAVLAVDPSSSRTGGSILGDRTRMGELSMRDAAFIRPSPSGGHLGGVARATRESMLVLEAAGYDVVIVETVGVGQSEVAVAEMVDTFLLLALARAGDQLQGIKRGILELADVIAMNKADGEHVRDAAVAARELTGALRLMRAGEDTPPPFVLTCSALTKTGLDEVWEAVLTHRQRLTAAGKLEERRAHQQRQWMWTMAETELLRTLQTTPAVRKIRHAVEADVAAGRMSAVDGTTRILEAFRADVIKGAKAAS